MVYTWSVPGTYFRTSRFFNSLNPGLDKMVDNKQIMV